MIPSKALQKPVCASCRLRATIATKQLARARSRSRSRKAVVGSPSRPPPLALPGLSRGLATSAAWRFPRSRAQRSPAAAAAAAAAAAMLRPSTGPEQGLAHEDEGTAAHSRRLTPEEAALEAREVFGDALPEDYLSDEALHVYERLYGKVFRPEEGGGDGVFSQAFARDLEDGQEGLKGDGRGGAILLREGRDGSWQEVEWDEDADETVSSRQGQHGREEMVFSDEIDEALARDIRAAQGRGVDSLSGPATSAEAAERETETDAEADGEDGDADHTQRTHPLTVVNRFGPSPSTVQLPGSSFVDPATLLLSGIPPVHLSEAARRVFGGVGLPFSTSTPAVGRSLQQRPIALDAFQAGMSEIEGDVYMAALMPGVYASVLSVLADTRKRLGTAWAERLVRKAATGELKILDAGGGGAAVLAVREMLRAEWERMHEESADDTGSTMALAEADGRLGGAHAAPPLGRATVLTGSDALRTRASQLLENTTFIPRLPDYVHTEHAKDKGKFDLIIAPHSLWPLREEYMRKIHTANLWSLLNADGGVLVLLEKGVSRGFEVIAAAREMLLEGRISSPESRTNNMDIDEPEIDWEPSAESTGPAESASADATVPDESAASRSKKPKDKGMIIGPCTNHAGCPMYVQKGKVKGRKEICHFEQRYIRPPFLQKLLGARDKNHEDVKFSYLAVMRGRDLRETEDVAHEAADANVEGEDIVKQGKEATERAFEGYTNQASSVSPSSADHGPRPSAAPEPPPHSLTLPRAILPPIKRRGHVILDLCTPLGTLERWTVPKSYGKQAYRDARKSQWGDLWALGAKTRVIRSVRSQNKHARRAAEQEQAERSAEGRGRAKKSTKRRGGGSAGIDVDEYGRIVTREGMDITMGMEMGMAAGEGGRMRTGKKVKGIRDKRDKKGVRNMEE